MKNAPGASFCGGLRSSATSTRSRRSRSATSRKRRSSHSRISGRFRRCGVRSAASSSASATVFLLFGALRYLQWQFPVLDGSLSWMPYVIVAVSGRRRHRPHGVAHHERHRQATTEGRQVREQSATRRELEASLRSLLPSEVQDRKLDRHVEAGGGRRGVGGLVDRLRLGPRTRTSSCAKASV